MAVPSSHEDKGREREGAHLDLQDCVIITLSLKVVLACVSLVSKFGLYWKADTQS